MGEGAILAVLVDAEEPDNGREQDGGRLDEEVALLGRPSTVEVEHDVVGTLVGIGDVGHELRVERVAAVAARGVVEVDDIELRPDLVAVQMAEQVVVGDGAQVRELEVVNIGGITLFNLLLDCRCPACPRQWRHGKGSPRLSSRATSFSCTRSGWAD